MSDHPEGRNGVVNPSVKFEPTDLSLLRRADVLGRAGRGAVVISIALWFMIPAILGPTPPQEPKEPWNFKTEGKPDASGLPARPELEGIDRTGDRVKGPHTVFIQKQIEEEEKTLNAPAGVEAKTGIRHIPIDEAMRRIAGETGGKP